jgi:hypothetical protein
MRIVSDGTPVGTKVLTDDGKPLDGVMSLNITATNDGVQADAKLFIHMLDIVGVPVRVMGPNGKYISQIKYLDGTIDDYSKG